MTTLPAAPAASPIAGPVLAGMVGELCTTTDSLIGVLRAQLASDGEIFCALFDALRSAVDAGALDQADGVLRQFAPLAEQLRDRATIE